MNKPTVTNVRRARAVIWVTDAVERQYDARRLAEDGMREKVRDMVGEKPGDPEIRLAWIKRVTPQDPEFDTISREEGHMPAGATPWISEWEVVG